MIKKLQFAYLFLKKIERELDSKGTGTTFKAISGKILKNVEFPLPPLPEQHRIVAKIEELFSELDNGIANLEKAKAQLKVYRQAVLKSAFEGKLTERWRTVQLAKGTLPSAEDLLARIQEERQNHYEQQLTEWREAVAEWEANASSAEAGRRRGKEGRPPSPSGAEALAKAPKGSGGQRKPSKPKQPKEYPPLTEKELGELPELPVGWKWVSLSNLVNSLDQGWSPKCENIEAGDDEWGVIKTTAIQAGSFLQNENKRLPKKLSPRHQHELKSGDILITRAGPRVRVGVCCLVKSVRHKLLNCDKAYRLKVCSHLMKPDFIVSVLNSPHYVNEIENIKSGINDSGVNLTQSTFLKLSIPICSVEEQHQIIQEIESRLSVCDHLEQEIEKALQKSEALRQSILKKAFEGRLAPQWPDLPAPQAGKYWVYVAKCSNDSNYIGQTADLRKRWSEHVSGAGADWTKKYPPKYLMYWEAFDSREEAVQKEKWLKTGFGRKWIKREETANRLWRAGEPAEVLLERIKAEKAK